jgi:hypothetical protein
MPLLLPSFHSFFNSEVMMKKGVLFDDVPQQDENLKWIGGRLYLRFSERNSLKVDLYHNDTLVKTIDLSDRVAKRLLVVEAVELGATKLRLANALQISRQTIHNYTEIKKHFGLEGLIHNYSPSTSKSLRKQRKRHADRRLNGNKARQVEQIRKDQREKLSAQMELSFGEQIPHLAPDDQPFAEEHDWKATRYAGAFTYLITLITQNHWLRLVMGYFGDKYQIFMVFILMAACNIRSIEQLKNLRRREAGIILGIKRLPTRLTARKWLHDVCKKKISTRLLTDFFRCQLRMGIVGTWLWFTDGHLLPYTGKSRLHPGYNTQRRMPVPGRTNLVTTDSSGRIVDFEIQEGKGDLRNYIVRLGRKWENDIPAVPIMVFDREGYGAAFFFTLIQERIPFVTWEKHIDTQKLEALEADRFCEEFEFNGKLYRVFEGEKTFAHTLESGHPHEFTLRRIYIWNVTSHRRTCALASVSPEQLSTKDCALAILNRWGASENTFKHLADKHPLHYQPGFAFVESEKQEITNPEYKEKKTLLTRMKKQLNKLYKKFSKSKEIYNKDGTLRKNSTHQRLKQEIQQQESEIDLLKQEAKEFPEKIDISCLEDYSCFQRICNESKNLFDFATSSVWNARKQMVEWLLPFYENKSEYIDLFYAITNCHGWVKSEKHTVIVRLEPLQQPSRRAAQEQFCRKLTQLGAITPAGKSLIIEVGQSPLK